MIDKAKLKKESKELKTPIGVYQIRNTVNGKVFIGTAKNVPGKLNGHQFTLKTGTHINKELQEEYNRHGAESFVFEMLDELKYKEDPDYRYEEELKFPDVAWIEKKLQPAGKTEYKKHLCIICPIATAGLPFPIASRVGRLMFSLSAIMVLLILLLSRARFMFSPGTTSDLTESLEIMIVL